MNYEGNYIPFKIYILSFLKKWLFLRKEGDKMLDILKLLGI